MDLLMKVLLGLGGILALIITFLISRFLDADWRCMQQRKFLKKNYHVLNILEGDGKCYRTMVVDINNSVARVGSYIWVISKGRVYRKDKSSMGFQINSKNTYFGNQGAPNVFVDKDTMKSIALEDPDKSNVNPDEFGSAVNTEILIERMKTLALAKRDDWMKWVSLGLLVIIVLLAYDAWQRTGYISECLKTGECIVGAAKAGAAGGAASGGSGVINQNPDGTVGK